MERGNGIRSSFSRNQSIPWYKKIQQQIMDNRNAFDTGNIGNTVFTVSPLPTYSRTDVSGMSVGSGMLRTLYYDTYYSYDQYCRQLLEQHKEDIVYSDELDMQ